MMDFETAYKKLKEGTATDEEAAYVARELENVRKISAILDQPSLSDPGIRKTSAETIQKARKTFNRKAVLRTILIVFCSLAAAAAVICAILFIPSGISARSSQKLSRDQAVSAAEEFLADQIGEDEEKNFYVDHVHRHLQYTGSIFEAIYVYRIEFENRSGDEYKVDVNSNSGYTVLRDIDLR